MQQKQEQKPEQEQEHDPSNVAVEINIPSIPANNENTFRDFIGGELKFGGRNYWS